MTTRQTRRQRIHKKKNKYDDEEEDNEEEEQTKRMSRSLAAATLARTKQAEISYRSYRSPIEAL